METQINNESLMIGLDVTFSIQKGETTTGKILDKISMKEKEDSLETITGYIIKEDMSGKLYNNVAHWRIKSINN